MLVRLLAVFLLVVNFASPLPIKAGVAIGSHVHATEMADAGLHSATHVNHEPAHHGHHKMKVNLVFDCATDNCHAVTLALSFQSRGHSMIAPKVIALNDAERPGIKTDFLRPPKAWLKLLAL